MKEAIHSENLIQMGEVMLKDWEAQKNLHSLMVNPIIKKTEQIALKNGAIGFKLNGAGGGGSATILAGMGSEYKLKKTFTENFFQILPVKLDFMGVQTWIN